MKIAVLVSGGVDSSVALKMLKDQGYDVTAFYLKIWLEDELSYLGDCPWQEDLTYVEAVCSQLEVPLRIIPFQKEYQDTIVAYTLQEIKAGKTPNPDMLCNQRIKFGAFLGAVGNEFDKIATGHYAQVEKIGDRYLLKTSPDVIKDQTYFLAHLSQQQLARALFPIGHLTKAELREHAIGYNLPTKNRKDSQGICFLGKLKFSDFIRHHLGERHGDFIEYETNTKVGEHKGFWFYTIGQRQGIGLGGGPWYVVGKDSTHNKIYISRSYFEAKERNKFFIGVGNWFQGCIPNQQNLTVKLRHGQYFHACSLEQIENNRWQVTLAENDQGIAPGQFAVFYSDNYCLGSAPIAE